MTATRGGEPGLATMSRFQWTAIAICIWLNVLDGFDVMVMAFTASHVAAEWALSGTGIGLALSAGLVGMAVGSLFLAPSADRFGRRPAILFCLVVLTVGMLFSALAANLHQLLAMRFVTGIGIGGMLASAGVIAAEYSTPRYRTLVLSLFTIGYPIGATVGGIMAVGLIEWQGWRSVFVVGAGLSLATIPLVLYALPESMDFLVSRRPAGALDRLNALRRRMRLPVVAALPTPAGDSAGGGGGGYARLFAPDLLGVTLLISAAFFLLMFGFYFVLSWTPKLLVDAGMSAAQGITGGVLLNLGGVVGGIAFGGLSTRFGLRPLTTVFLLGTAAGLASFGYAGTHLTIAFVVAGLIGFALIGSMSGLYALAPAVYAASVRATGLGCAIGIGRIGGIVSPVTVGVLVDMGWAPGRLYYLFVLPLALAALAVFLIRRRL